MVEAQALKLSLSITKLRGVRSRQEFDGAIGEIRSLYGFAHLVFLCVRSPVVEGPLLLYCTTYPEEWTSRYLQKEYFNIDPVVAIYRTGFQPVDWSSLDLSSEKTRDLFSEAVEMGVGRNGVTVPIRGPSGERSLFSATSNMPRREWRDLRASARHDLMLLSHYMHERFLSINGIRTRHHRGLSRREQECLQLLARGVVPKRIASRLQLSESAVRLYLGTARRKLKAETTYQAIARASFLELIEV
jgi:DNA-binding CsgD family transcriptional regulator